MHFLRSLQLSGFLSFAPWSDAIPLTPLNVVIGPNGSGKSNLIEAVELLHTTPLLGFSDAIGMGGGVEEWVWKGEGSQEWPFARIEASIAPLRRKQDYVLDYELDFGHGARLIGVETLKHADHAYYHYIKGDDPVVCDDDTLSPQERKLDASKLIFNESILSQLKGFDRYPVLTQVGELFSGFQTFREWSFGRSAQLRRPQSADLPSNTLLPGSQNLGLLLNQLDHLGISAEFNRLLKRFLPRYQRYSTLVQGSTVQTYLHEDGFKEPISAARLSDGTLRFMAMLALLLSPTPPPLLCIEEPELGLHPDAVTLLAEVITEASTRTQIIVTTHSDALVSAFTEQTESVLVCEYLGGSVLKRLESAKLRSWLDEYSLGEIWRMGALGGNP